VIQVSLYQRRLRFTRRTSLGSRQTRPSIERDLRFEAEKSISPIGRFVLGFRDPGGALGRTRMRPKTVERAVTRHYSRQYRATSALVFIRVSTSMPGLALTAGVDVDVTGGAGVDASRVSDPAKDSDDVSVSSVAKQMYAFMPHSYLAASGGNWV
jgi:hypothetical protein